MHRNTEIQRLKTETFDLCVIGAGASGAGAALDATLRGLKVALIDREDFASGTSSKSTKLIHGGVRYLEQAFKNLDFAQLKQVRHGLEERHLLLANAPHLSRPLGLITPVFSWWEGLYFSIGLKMYGWFAAGKDTLPKSRWLSKKSALQHIPGLSKKVHSAVMYYDGQHDDARYCVALAKSAHESGAVVANHLSLTDFNKNADGQITSAAVLDQLTGESFELRARIFLNCTGPYADAVRSLANPALTQRVRPSKGVHVMLPMSVLGGNDAMLIPKTKDGRVVFAIPFEHKVMLGTTDNDYQHLQEEPVLESEEVDFLLETLQPFINTPVDKKQISAGFGGLRPLLAATGKGTKNLVRDHEVEIDATSGLISLLGGKWTTYRLMAEDAIDAVSSALAPTGKEILPCRTRHHALAGGANYQFEDWEHIEAEYQLGAEVCRHLMLKYGTEARAVAEITRENPAWRARLHADYPHILAEAVFAARCEMACTLRDFVARRIRLEITDWDATAAALSSVAAAMATVLGWDAATQSQQITSYHQQIDYFKKCAF